jgi:serine/threonine protein kinase/beta-lactam-binding protein with PASTA domain
VQTAATDALVGRSLEGRYRILERIARGGMSTVYAAVDERLDRLVAVKVMSSALSADPAFTDRFAREARAAARLTHLNAVSVYDQGSEIAPDGHHVFLVMELVDGRTLRELLRERGRLSPAEAISIMEPVLSALSAAHRAGLVHRDVKPENILLSDDGIVKVADFGLARAVESDPTATRTGLMMGTVAYCAPEQISRGNADPRSDVYSAGIVLFELLTGTPPYKGESAMNVAWQHVHSRVPAPSSRIKGIPSEIDELVINATDSDPESRPADAGAFLAEIADVRSDLGLPVMPVPPRARPRGRSVRTELRNRTPDAETTDMIRGGASTRHDTAVVPGAGNGRRTTPVPPRRDEPGGPPPPVVIPPPKSAAATHRRRRRRLVIAIVAVLVLLASTLGGVKLAHYVDNHFMKHVPKVTGQTQAAAIAALEKAGYHVPRSKIYSAFSETVTQGRVIRTDPGTGARLATGKDVAVTVSSGPRLYGIPNVRGDAFDDALDTLKGVGLNVAQMPKQQAHDTVPEGEVIGTSPKVGSKVSSKEIVTIIVSTGPPIVDVPHIPQGTPYADARRTLKNSAGAFAADRVDEFSDAVDPGAVISINPSDKARKGSTITVTVSKGPEIVQVPDIKMGTPIGDAEKAIQDAGLVPDIRPFAGAGTPTTVLAISPGGGTRVKAGSKVVVYALSV